MLADDVIDWFDNGLGKPFEKKHRLRVATSYAAGAAVFLTIVIVFYFVMTHTGGIAASIMGTMILIVVLAVVVVSVVGAIHKMKWGRAIPLRVGLSQYGIWFEYRRGRRVFVGAARLLGVRRMRWWVSNQILITHWGYLPMPDGKFVTDEIAQLVSRRFPPRQL